MTPKSNQTKSNIVAVMAYLHVYQGASYVPSAEAYALYVIDWYSDLEQALKLNTQNLTTVR